MIMTKRTELGERILGILRAAGGELSRRQLGELMGRTGHPYLNQYDIRTLEDLVAAGDVVRRQVVVGTVAKEYRYRAK